MREWKTGIMFLAALYALFFSCGESGRADGDADGQTAGALACLRGVCIDPATGLEWQQQPTDVVEGQHDWALDAAVLHCQYLDLNGGGWRLPDIAELRSLIRGCPVTETGGACGVTEECLCASCNSRSCDGCPKGNGPDGGCYWPAGLHGECWTYRSWSPYWDDQIEAYWVSFSRGALYVLSSGSHPMPVRCVRGGIGIPAGNGDPAIEWVPLPSGTFEMGCREGVGDCPVDGRESPAHRVAVPAFEIARRKITVDQYAMIAGLRLRVCCGHCGHTDDCSDNGGGECPAENLTWHEARAYCESVGGRLPTEAEWEYAATIERERRAVSGIRPTIIRTEAGDAPDGIDMLTGPPEWVEDCWHDSYAGAPADGGVWEGGDCSRRVVRGGDIPRAFSVGGRAAWRTPYFPTVSYYIGIRCVRDFR